MDTFTRAGKKAEACGYKDGEPCGHPGCLHHGTHPCEKCGRVAGVDVEKLLLLKIEAIREEYEKDIKPYVDDLLKFRNMRTSPLTVVYNPDLIKYVSEIKHDHRCYCGEASVVPHKVGELGCKRFLTDEHPVPEGDDCRVEGEVISWTTLYYQRGYYRFPCGCWSRWKDSSNSLEEK